MQNIQAPLAQGLERRPHKPWVLGSKPRGRTKKIIMLKGILVVTLLGFGSDEPLTHEYLVKEIPTEVEGRLHTSVLYHENDTIQVMCKTFVVLEIVK